MKSHGRQRRSRWLAAACILLTTAPAFAAPDYAALDAVLLANVRNGYVDYDGIGADPRFGRFLTSLADPPGNLPDRAAELAYYINAYNAFAIKGILDGHSTATRFGRYRYFRSLDFRLGGRDVTLHEIEHERLRPLGDARIHFAIVCASMSCARLANRAWLPERIDEQLDQAARRFVNDPTRNRFDIAQKQAFVSPLFDVFAADFATTAGGVPAFLARWVDDPATRAALDEGRLAVAYLPYDWDLNGSYTARPTE